MIHLESVDSRMFSNLVVYVSLHETVQKCEKSRNSLFHFDSEKNTKFSNKYILWWILSKKKYDWTMEESSKHLCIESFLY